MEHEAWLVNPRRKRRKTRVKRRRRNPQRGVAIAAPIRRAYRRARVARAAVNPRRRRRRVSGRRRSSYRRNPPQFQTVLNQLVPVTAGFIATKFVGNMVSPMLAQFMPGNGGPFLRILSKFGIAYLTAWGAEQFMGRRFFMPVMLGGSLEGIQDFFGEFVAPMFPALQAYQQPLSIYYEPPPELPSPEAAMEEAANSNQVGAYHDQSFRVMI